MTMVSPNQDFQLNPVERQPDTTSNSNMTLVLSSLGKLVQAQFGVNEIASAVVVGKAFGSLVIRQSDAAVFLPLAQEYGLFVREIPKHLEYVAFDRSGTIFGSNSVKSRSRTQWKASSLIQLRALQLSWS